MWLIQNKKHRNLTPQELLQFLKFMLVFFFVWGFVCLLFLFFFLSFFIFLAKSK